jgi:hypothetical protein
MAIDLQNPTNIGTGWGRPPDFSAPSIGSLVAGVLENRYRQQKLQQDSIAEAIKEYQSQRSDKAYIQAAQNAGVLPQGDYSGMSAKAASDLAQRIQDMTPDTEMDNLHKAMAAYYNAGADAGGRGGSRGTPRVWRQLPNGEWTQFTPGEAYKIDQQKMATQNYGKLSEQESSEQAAADAIAKKWGGIDTSGSGVDFVNKPGGFLTPADPQKQAEYQRDYAEFQRHSLEADKTKKLKLNYEKWYRGQLQPGGDQPDGQTNEEDDGSTPPPQAGATPPPSVSQNDVNQVTQAPGITPSPIPYAQTIPAGTPRPGAPPPSDSAAGHASTYGTPAPGMTPSSQSSGQAGDLVIGQSKRFLGGKAYTWWGDKGWVPD